jgi:hypothetical protein
VSLLWLRELGFSSASPDAVGPTDADYSPRNVRNDPRKKADHKAGLKKTTGYWL